MSMRKFILAHERARMGVADYAMKAPDGQEVTFKDPSKSPEQEQKYHAMIGEICEQYQFCGRHWDSDDMKRLLIDQFKRDTINDSDFSELWKSIGAVDMCPSIDGSGVVMLGVQSRKFPKKLAIAFIEWLHAFGAENNVEFARA